MKEELVLNTELYSGKEDDYDSLKAAIQGLMTASQEQFESIKQEKWYNRVFDMITFSKKEEKRLAEQIGTLAQAQQIFVELLLRLSNNDYNISKIILDSMSDIQKLQEQDIYLLGRIKCLENQVLGIKPDMDINRLAEKEKRILCACLYKISDKNAENSNEQKLFANEVVNYLAVDVQMENPMSMLQEICNESKRIILACCMEYIFLKSCSEEGYDEYLDFIEEFDFGNKTINEIKKQIASLYKLRGSEGFYTKYQVSNFENIEDTFIIEFDNMEENSQEVDIELTEENITSILQIKRDENKVYSNKEIHISTYINCEGNIEFNNCVIYYNETDAGDEITVKKGGNISILDSVIVCKGIDRKPFILCEGDNKIVIESTTFIDCSDFMKATNGCSFVMNNCKIQNCLDRFLDINIGKKESSNIINNVVLQNDINELYFNDTKGILEDDMISISSYGDGSVHFVGNVIYEEESYRLKRNKLKKSYTHFRYIYAPIAVVQNCSFLGLSSGLWLSNIKECSFENCTEGIYAQKGWESNSKDPVIDDCVFINCTNVIYADNDTKITNCQFVSCYNSLISSSSFWGGIRVEFCQFSNIKNLPDNNARVGFEQERSCIMFRRAKEASSKANYLKKCIFEGVSIDKNFLIAATGYEKPYDTVTYIEDCDFRNCETKRGSGKIIKEYIYYDTLFKKNQEFHANKLNNCRGLDRINKEMVQSDVNVEIKRVSTNGNQVGSALIKCAIGGAAFTIGGPVALGAVVAASAVNTIRKKV